MIRIHTLRFSNMFRFGEDVEIHFNSRVTQLNGINGSGKSSIPAVLEDLFYNRNSRGVKKASLKNRLVATNKYSSSADFTVGNDNYTIRKETASTTKVTLIKNGKDISGHTASQTYEIIRNLFNMDFATFTKLVYQSMNSNLDFLLATDSNRKKFLTSLLGLEDYAKVAQNIKGEITIAKGDLTGLKATISSLERMVDKTAQGRESLLDKVEIPEVYIPDVDVAAIQKQIEDANVKNYEIKVNEENRRKLEVVESRARQIVEPAQPEGFENFEQLKVSYQKGQRTLSELQGQINLLKVPSDTCPTCGADLGNEDQRDHILNELKILDKKYTELHSTNLAEMKKIKTYSNYVDDLRKFKASEKEVNDLRASVNYDLPRELIDVGNLREILVTTNKEIADNARAIRVAEEHNHSVDLKNARVLAALENNEKALKEIKLHTTTLEKQEDYLAKLEVLNKAFGTKGLISYKIESVTKVFEELINEYLVLLSNGRFNLVFQIEDTKLALKVFDNGEEVEVQSLSSGEFNRLNTSTLLAIRKMMSAVSKVDLNLLFLDEVVSVLDQEGKDTLIEVLLNEKDLNTIVVSHGYTHPLAETIQVAQGSDGISYLSEVLSVE